MKQLLIVKKATALFNDGHYPGTSALSEGQIGFHELGATSWLSAAPTKNFAIHLGRANGVPFVIPEVDVNTLSITKAIPVLGKAFKRKFTFPTPVKGEDYTVIFVKKATVPHERNTWTCTITAGSTSASTEATALKKVIEEKLGEYFSVTISTADITVTAKTIGDAWEAKFADELTGTSWAGSTNYVDAIPSVGDTEYIKKLASMCAAGKGFTDTEISGRDIYPGYPEAVEEFELNTSGANSVSTKGYAVYTLRFQVGRDSAKTRDEKVWQLVHIAVPIDSSAYSSVDAILPEGEFSKNAAAAMAAATVTTMVKAASLNE